MIYLFTCINDTNEYFHFYFGNDNIYRFDVDKNEIYSWLRKDFGLAHLMRNSTVVSDIILCIPEVLIVEDVRHIKDTDTHDYMENYILSKILENIN